jgi:hypothetical protein
MNYQSTGYPLMKSINDQVIVSIKSNVEPCIWLKNNTFKWVVEAKQADTTKPAAFIVVLLYWLVLIN